MKSRHLKTDSLITGMGANEREETKNEEKNGSFTDRRYGYGYSGRLWR